MNVTSLERTGNSMREPGDSQDWKALIADAANEVFGLMVGGDITARDGFGEQAGGLTAMLGLAGFPCGVFRVRCSWAAASAIAGRMLGTAGSDLPADQVCDALGEICNMVAGSMKGRLADHGAACMMSVPSVVLGVDYEVRCLACEPSHSIVMEFDGQPVLFHLNLQS